MSLKKYFFCFGLALVMLGPFSSIANGNLAGEEKQEARSSENRKIFT